MSHKVETLAQHTDADSGICAQVYRSTAYPATPYGVRIVDLDADEVLPVFKFFKHREEANAYATKCANGNGAD